MKLLTSLQFIRVFKSLTLSMSMSSLSQLTTKQNSLLSAEEALQMVNNYSNIKFIDGSWHLNKSRNGYDEFLSERIKDSQYFNIDEISDKSSSLPHMLPSASYFKDCVEQLGISSGDHVIVYTKPECFSAARVWWTFQVFGHKNVYILNGGFNSWKTINGPIESGPLKPVSKGSFEAVYNNKLVNNWEDVLNIVKTGSAQILDARSKARFLAQAPEPRPGLPSGHIPGSLNLPFNSLLQDNDFTTFKSLDIISDEILKSGVIFGSKTVLSCGSGVSASVLAFGLHLIGKELHNHPIYDGSWSEWGSRDDLPRIP